MATAIRIKPASHKILQQIATLTGQSLQEELDCAIEDRRRKVYLEGLANDYAALKKVPKVWKELQLENELWDSTNRDGEQED